LGSITQISEIVSKSNLRCLEIYYTGQGRELTGDWCTADEDVSLKDVLQAITKGGGNTCHIRLKSTCSYSGKWVIDAVQMAEETLDLDNFKCLDINGVFSQYKKEWGRYGTRILYGNLSTNTSKSKDK